MQLEQNLEIYQPRVSETRQQTYFIIGDLESLNAGALYGDMDRGYDFKELEFQLHIHEDSKDGITASHLKKYGEEKQFSKLNNYDALMGEVNAINLGVPKINIGS